MAGVILPGYSLKNVLIGLIDDGGTMKRINMAMVNVLDRPRQYRGEINPIPSIVVQTF